MGRGDFTPLKHGLDRRILSVFTKQGCILPTIIPCIVKEKNFFRKTPDILAPSIPYIMKGLLKNISEKTPHFGTLLSKYNEEIRKTHPRKAKK